MSENKLIKNHNHNCERINNKSRTHTQNTSLKTHQQPHPLKTIEEYLQALIWMMKRLLGLRKMTSQLKRTSMIKLTIVACVLWVGIIVQIKVDSRKGKLLFRTLRALTGVLSVFAALGVTCMLGFKVHQKIIYGQSPPKKQPQYLLYERK